MSHDLTALYESLSHLMTSCRARATDIQTKRQCLEDYAEKRFTGITSFYADVRNLWPYLLDA